MFGSPSMLWWALAATLPLIIHFLLRRRRRTIDWGAMRLVLQAARGNARPLKIWQWILLMLRCLALGLLAIAAAQPLGCRMPELAKTSRRATILVLDASYSMRSRSGVGNETLWDRAKREALERLSQLREDDDCVVVLMAQSPRVLSGSVRGDARQVRTLLEQAECSFMPADLAATMPMVLGIARAMRTEAGELPEPTPLDTEIVFWSDGQRGTWQSALEQTGGAGIDELLQISRVEFVWLRSDPTVRNAACTDLRFEHALPVAGNEFQVIATVTNHAMERQPERSLRLVVDGVVRESQSVDLSEGEVKDVVFSIRLDAGSHRLQAALDGDALESDDARWATLEVRSRVRIAVIGETAARRMVQVALQPETEDANDEIEVIAGEAEILTSDPGGWDALIFCDQPRWGKALSEAVQVHLDRGKGVLYWFGSRTRAEEVNRWLWDRGEHPLVPLPLKDVAESGSYSIDPNEYTHPIVAPFESYPDAGLLSVPLFRYWQLEKADDEGADVALGVSTGDPLMVTRQLEDQASVAMMLVPAELAKQDGDAWSGLPVWPSFVPLIEGWLRWSLQASRPSGLVGEALEGTIHDPNLESVTVVCPDDGERVIAVSRDTDEGRWRFNETSQPGIYTWFDGSRSQACAMNVAPDEGDLREVDTVSLQRRFRQQPESDSGEPARSSDERIEWTSRPLFRWFLIALLGTLVTEMTVLGWMRRRFG